MVKRAVIVAAGRAIRLHPLTEHFPKTLLKVGGMSLLERSVQSLQQIGIKRIAIVTGFHSDLIERDFAAQATSFTIRSTPNVTTWDLCGSPVIG
jgi:choline kinase